MICSNKNIYTLFVVAGDMSSGSYFTHLLGVDVEESQDLSPTTHTPPDHGLAASKGSQGRTKNFKDEEDRLLVSAWLNVGMDPIQGVAQPQSSFWSRIHDYYHANKSFQLDRTQGSLMHRWSAIQHDVNIFCSCVIKIQNRNQSGCSVDDKVHLFLPNKLYVFYAFLSQLQIHVYIEIYRLQAHVHCSRKKTRSTGTLPLCIAGEF
jgi:hypothetical protein